VDLVEEGMDLAIRIRKLPDSDLIARKLADCSLMACASPIYLAAAGTPSKPTDLNTHALIGYIGDVTTAQWTFVPKGRTNLPSDPPPEHSPWRRWTAIDAERLDCSRTHATRRATHNHNTGFDFPDNVGDIWKENKHGSWSCRASGARHPIVALLRFGWLTRR